MIIAYAENALHQLRFWRNGVLASHII